MQTVRNILGAATVAAFIVTISACAPQSAALPAASPAADALQTHDCVMGKTRVPSICGSLRVYEDRTAGAGRTLDIHFIVLKAMYRTGRAVFWNPGGPGASATDAAPFLADGDGEVYLSKLRDTFDIVFVDNRGTGLSHQLRCRMYDAADPASYFLELWPHEALSACRDALSKTADLDDYTTDMAADDLDDIRAALGYDRIALSGDSGGTTFFLDYARRHPKHVASLLLEGVAPPHFLIIPLQDPPGAQLAMDRVIADCAADAACAARFPDLGDHFRALVARFDHGPIRIGVVDVATHRRVTVMLSKEVFADRLRQTMYSTDSAAYVPFVIDRAYAGDYVPLGTLIEDTTIGLDQIVPSGINLSVTCAEDVPFITEAEIAATSAGSFMGDSRVRAQQRACRIWNVKPVPASFQDPVRTSAPVLMISGADDPATPPIYSLQALKYFTNGMRVLIANASHDTEVPCMDALAERFIRESSTKHLDAAGCAGAYHRPPFAASMQGFGD